MNQGNPTPLISIVVPISQMAGRLSRLFNWTKSLEGTPALAIWVHDKKDEATGIELRKFILENEDLPITLLEGEFGSPGAARNHGLDACGTKLVAFCDSDDEIEMGELVDGANKLAMGNCQIAVAPFFIRDLITGKKELRKINGIEKTFSLSVAYSTGVWRYIFKKEFLDGITFEKFLMGEDQLFILQVLLKSPRILTLNSPYYTYIVNQQEQATKTPKSINEIILTNKKTEDLVTKSLNKSERNMVLFFYWNQCLTILNHLGVRNLIDVYRESKVRKEIRLSERMYSFLMVVGWRVALRAKGK